MGKSYYLELHKTQPNRSEANQKRVVVLSLAAMRHSFPKKLFYEQLAIRSLFLSFLFPSA